MIRNYYTLLHIVKDINKLSGWIVSECFTQDKDSFIISLNDGIRESFIVFNSDSKYDSIYLKANFKKARKNSVNILSDLEGDIFQNAEVVGKSRIVKLNFLHTTCYAVMFGGIHSNFLLVNSKGIIFDSFKDKKSNVGLEFVIKEENHPDFQQFPQNTSIKSALANSNLLFGSTYANEVLHRLPHIDSNTLLSELSSIQFNNIRFIVDNIINELINSDKFFVMEDDHHRKVMSPLALIDMELKSFHQICSEAVDKKIVSDIIDSEFRNEHKTILNYLQKEEHKLRKQLENMSDLESAYQRKEEYRIYADILMSHPNNKSKYGNNIILKDWNGQDINIKLDQKLNLLENAKKYYDKVRSTNEDIKIRKIRIPAMQRKLESVIEKIEEVKKATHIKELARFETGIKKVTGTRINTAKMTMEDKFRKFDLGEGYILYAGKNATNNDELTVKFAKPNDIWLHARGTSGSHTIIRMEKEEKPPKHILQKAAEITAYYSGAKNAKYTAVIWTFKKYVRKPKGANPGSVTVAKEAVIMAEPKLPDTEI